MDRPLTVVHAIASMSESTGGPARSVATLTSALADAGTCVKLVTLDVTREYGPAVAPASRNVHVIAVPGWGNRKLRIAHGFGYRKALDQAMTGASILHSHGLWMPVNHQMALSAHSARTPHVISPRGMLLPGAMRTNGLKKKLAWHAFQRRDLRNAAGFHATSADEAEAIRRLEFKQPIAVIPPGIELPVERISTTDGTSRQKRALFLSRIHPIKGVTELLHAWKLATAHSKDWHLTVAGPDEDGHLAEVRALSHKLGLDAVVDFPGAIGDDAKWQLYQSSDLFVLPTKSENFGRVIAEALASGVPVITTRGAPWPALLSRRCGWWTDIGVEPFGLALKEALALAPLVLREMGARGRAMVEESYGWPRVTQQMIAFYRWLCSGGQTPAEVQT